MIRLPTRPPAPIFFTRGAESLVRATADFFAKREGLRRQQKFEVPFLPPKVFAATLDKLLEYSSDKCVYCESPIRHPGNASLERFRPKAGALDKDGSFSTEHYWWLAFEWRNLYTYYVTCNKAKGSKFPMKASRATPGTPYDQLLDEPRLLLDPAIDDPEKHFTFESDGKVAALTPEGEATLATLELNRPDLVRSRKDVGNHARQLLDIASVGGYSRWPHEWRDQLPVAAARRKMNKGIAELAQLVSGNRPFAAVARYLVQAFMDAHIGLPAKAVPEGAQAVSSATISGARAITQTLRFFTRRRLYEFK